MVRASAAKSVRRILREWRELSGATAAALARGEPLAWSAHPIDASCPFEWHFTVRGPADSAFEAGIYHGKIVLPTDYPLAPPDIYFATMNGRFDIGKAICLNITKYHPEEWQPAWGIGSMLDAVQAFFDTPANGAAYSLEWSAATRKQLALQSSYYRCAACGKTNKELIEGGHPLFDDAPAEEEEPAPPAHTPSAPAPQYGLLASFKVVVVLAVTLAARICKWKSWKIIAAAAALLALLVGLLSHLLEGHTWFVQHFPIHRPGQVTVEGDVYELTPAELIQDFSLHPYLQWLAM